MLIDNKFLDRLTQEAKLSPRKRMNYDLRDSDEDASMRMINAIEPESMIPIHRHRDTSEDVICIRGKVAELLFDDKGNEVARYLLLPGSDSCACHVPLGQYHTCRSLESGSAIIEFKNGKYNPITTEDIL